MCPKTRGAPRGSMRGAQPDPQTVPSPGGTSVTRSVVTDLAAWRRLRRAPAGGQWWGGRRLWTWDEAARSERRWSA